MRARTWLHREDAYTELGGDVHAMRSGAWMILQIPQDGALVVGLRLNGTVYLMLTDDVDELAEGLETVRGDLARMALGLEPDTIDA